MRRQFVAGNWKMNTNLKTCQDLAAGLAKEVPLEDRVDVLIAPPFPYLLAVGMKTLKSGVKLGAQNVYYTPPGAFTGEVSASMLLDFECSHVIIGHSERRHQMGETDEIVNKKVRHVLKEKIKVILCVGELLSEREAQETEVVLQRQMGAGLAGVSPEDVTNVVIAYEPVWAIGTGKTATPDQAQAAHLYLRSWLAAQYGVELAQQVRILYGGSVKPDNAHELLSQPDVDGALVGGASLNLDQFLAIIDVARKLS